ncbi:putative protein [Arabidopsis thaliana]|uniref:Arabidopsis thaliana genomic DNA, chromosome 5, P1 clone:MOK16 n=1 Tax=Arabidopsis thaliana TaxID=3702 RepID=Q9LYX4_ARATH|nr:protamine P1 family protein [Arabidopsis thaliana]AAR24726.1 At5g03110 [Arabidopsis thaliana]AAS47665.1 At5g03110 [Arabidopsis thaliana]AED90557.1 protamine P1 family protein [Arabidopsis thaliana]BAB08372.1 unnamed protein product [Arabidopsis thaliana]CAB86078.1 putative protein [Arabidopsis thaliana]|eukprot:NP_195931.1 protamine P1 family protein [Arabidopsis thaliana]
MMISRRPVSSPGRVEKYPPPFMGFLRSKSNGGSTSRSRSRSRGRSRASPLFVRRNKSAAAVAQEPSSPKVTCMGQVRVNRSKPKIKPESRDNPTRRRCEWLRNASFYNKFAGKIKTMTFWPKWRLCSFSCACRNLKEKDSPRSQLDHPTTESVREIKEEIEGEENFEIPKLFVSPATTPPINALLLTRSRSAPYRSSSLAFRFWEENNQREVESQQNVRSEKTDSEVPIEKINGFHEPEYVDRDEEEFTKLRFVRQPVLTRSKSEPARIGEKMMVLLPDEEEG